MTDIFIFTLGIVLGCAISYVFFKTGIKSNIEAFSLGAEVIPKQPINVPENDEIQPENDTSMDWDGYPYTNDYNDAEADKPIILGKIDPDTDEKN